MKIDFKDKTVLVTGGTRGSGAAIAKQFRANNANVIATGTNTDGLKIDNKIKYKTLDFSSEESTDIFIRFLNDLPTVDVLINNAGINKVDQISEINKDDWDLLNKINLRGPFLLTKAVSKIMKKNRSGHIINISSIFGVVSKSGRTSYSSTKSGLIGLTKAVALDLAPFNIVVNSVSPGFVDTELTRKILNASEINEIEKTIPQKRFASPDEIAKIVILLSSEHNTYINGQNIIIDGGYTSV